MEMQDKRLIDKLPTNEHAQVEAEILAVTPDAADKFEEIELDHEPIQLLQKLAQRKRECALHQTADSTAANDAFDDSQDNDSWDDDDDDDLDDAADSDDIATDD